MQLITVLQTHDKYLKELNREIDNTIIRAGDFTGKGGVAQFHLQDKWVWEAIPWAGTGLWAVCCGLWAVSCVETPQGGGWEGANRELNDKAWRESSR